VLPDAKHLLPLEQPAAVAALIASAATGIVPNRPALPPIGAAYRALIGSARVSARTRAALLDRAGPVSGAPAALPARAYAVLVAVLDRVVPQGEAPIDLAARIDAQLAAGTGDGWRFDALPPDLTAYTDALETLDDQGFLDMDGAGQDRLLQHAATGPLPMQRWFEELRGDAAKAYVAHPATMARLGYSGIAYGGDTDRLSGFQALGIGAREPWEPA